MIDCATQRVTTSASVSLLRAFFFLSGRRSSAVQNTAVSNRSRSASILALLGSGCDRYRRLRPRCSAHLPNHPARGIRGTTHLGRPSHSTLVAYLALFVALGGIDSSLPESCDPSGQVSSKPGADQVDLDAPELDDKRKHPRSSGRRSLRDRSGILSRFTPRRFASRDFSGGARVGSSPMQSARSGRSRVHPARGKS